MRRPLAFIGLFMLIGFGIYQIGFTIDQPYEATYNQVQRAISGADTITALTLGNSHSASVDFESLGIKGGYHLHAGFMDIFEIHHLSKYIIPKLPKLKYVFIAVPYYFFDFDNAAYLDAYQLSFRKRTYFMTPQFSLIGNDWENLLSAKLSPIIRPDHWKGVFAELLKNQLDKIAVLRPVEASKVDSAFLKKHAIGRVKQNETQVDTMLYSKPDLAGRSARKLKELIHFFKENHVTPIFYTPSYHSYYSNRFSKEIKIRNVELMKQIAADENIHYFDFSKDSLLTYRTDIYKDSDHYNTLGKKVFSAQLRDSLLKRGILAE